jgi:hypothetical protein
MYMFKVDVNWAYWPWEILMFQASLLGRATHRSHSHSSTDTLRQRVA